VNKEFALHGINFKDWGKGYENQSHPARIRSDHGSVTCKCKTSALQ
jgi:hypothetical protein